MFLWIEADTLQPMGVRVSRILHAGYELEFDGTVLGFDPIFENPFSRNCFAFPEVEFNFNQIRALRWDAVFISHFHDDHCSLDSLNLLDRRTPIYLYSVFEELHAMIRELGFHDVWCLQLGVSVRVGSFEVTPISAFDTDVDCLFHIRAGDLHLLNVVDSVIHPKTYGTLEKMRWDLVMWPFQPLRETAVLSPSAQMLEEDFFPSEWAEELQLLNPRILIPSACQFRHEEWSWYNHALFPLSYKDFQERLTTILPECRVVRLDPSCTLHLTKESCAVGKTLSWVRLAGEGEVDYQFFTEQEPSSTREIAMHLPGLSAAETERVFAFCRDGILERYPRLFHRVETYFHGQRVWSLSLFDHHGQAVEFRYVVQGSSIALTERIDVSWTTEVPLTKLFMALEHGETLTSMYLRVKVAKSAEAMEDPLIRVLFEGQFGSYQREQLRRIRATSIR